MVKHITSRAKALLLGIKERYMLARNNQPGSGCMVAVDPVAVREEIARKRHERWLATPEGRAQTARQDMANYFRAAGDTCNREMFTCHHLSGVRDDWDDPQPVPVYMGTKQGKPFAFVCRKFIQDYPNRAGYYLTWLPEQNRRGVFFIFLTQKSVEAVIAKYPRLRKELQPGQGCDYGVNVFSVQVIGYNNDKTAGQGTIVGW